jgi:hypothetical protein
MLDIWGCLERCEGCREFVPEEWTRKTAVWTPEDMIKIFAKEFTAETPFVNFLIAMGAHMDRSGQQVELELSGGDSEVSHYSA